MPSPERPHPDQLDFFLQPLYPVRSPSPSIDIDRFRGRLKRDMARAIRESAHSRPVIAARMAQYLGLPVLSKATLDAYTAESKLSHDVSLVRFKAFVRATGATWLWDTIVAEDGLTLLEGDEARFAEIARLQQEQRAILQQLRTLRASPVTIKRRGQS